MKKIILADSLRKKKASLTATEQSAGHGDTWTRDRGLKGRDGMR